MPSASQMCKDQSEEPPFDVAAASLLLLYQSKSVYNLTE